MYFAKIVYAIVDAFNRDCAHFSFHRSGFFIQDYDATGVSSINYDRLMQLKKLNLLPLH